MSPRLNKAQALLAESLMPWSYDRALQGSGAEVYTIYNSDNDIIAEVYDESLAQRICQATVFAALPTPVEDFAIKVRYGPYTMAVYKVTAPDSEEAVTAALNYAESCLAAEFVADGEHTYDAIITGPVPNHHTGEV